MVGKRKRLSGASYRKLALLKKDKNISITKSCMNIADMFKSANKSKY